MDIANLGNWQICACGLYPTLKKKSWTPRQFLNGNLDQVTELRQKIIAAFSDITQFLSFSFFAYWPGQKLRKAWILDDQLKLRLTEDFQKLYIQQSQLSLAF